MRVASVVKLWAGTAWGTNSLGRPASAFSGPFSRFGRGGTTGGTRVALALSSSPPRGSGSGIGSGIHDLLSGRRAATARGAGGVVVMTSKVPPTGAPSTGSKPGGSINKKRTFYRRTLKPPCVAFSSGDGRVLFREALVEGTMESYFRLAEQFRTQDEPAFCGLSTLTMVLNALAVDPGRVWKGAWRWYHESMLDCCAPLDVVKNEGVTMPTLCCLARCNGLTVETAGPESHSIEDLRGVVEECSSEDRGRVVVVSYDRRGVNQTGTGHFSPVGGYHRSRDMVLVMDTARFKHPPHWMPLEVLWEAMKRVDPVTGQTRGFMVLEKAHNLSHRLFTANSTKYQDWPQVAAWVNDIIEQASSAPEQKKDGGCHGQRVVAPVAGGDNGVRGLRDATTVAEFVTRLQALLPPVVTGLLTTFNSTQQAPSGGGNSENAKLQEVAAEGVVHDDSKFQDGVVLQALQGTEVYRELTGMERFGRPGRTASADSISTGTDAVRTGGGVCGGKGPGACGEKGPNGCGVSGDRAADAGAGAGAPPPAPLRQVAAAAAADTPYSSSLAPTPPSSPSSLGPGESGCGCSSRHVVTILSYALLLLLHKRDHEGSGGGADGDEDGDGDGDGGLPQPLWRKDPLQLLPAPVADEAKHVAGMLRGLVEMERCEKCSPS